MGKSSKERTLGADMAQAVSKKLRVSPQKLGLLVRTIRKKKVSAALSELEFSKKRIAADVRKCLMSAVANAEHNHGLDVDSLVVVEAHVGKGLVLKRGRPRAKARFCAIRKPFSQLTIIVRESEELQ